MDIYSKIFVPRYFVHESLLSWVVCSTWFIHLNLTVPATVDVSWKYIIGRTASRTDINVKKSLRRPKHSIIEVVEPE